MVRPGFDEHRTGIHPVCQQFYDGYLASHGEPPGRNQMAKAVHEAGISREKAHRDWHTLRHATPEETEMERHETMPPHEALEALTTQLAQLRQDRARDTAVIMSLLRSVETLESQVKALEAQVASDHEAAVAWRDLCQILQTDNASWNQLAAILQTRGPHKHSRLTRWLCAHAHREPVSPWE